MKASVFNPVAGYKFSPAIFKKLYVQVIIAMLLGITFGSFFPDIATHVKPLADIFIRMIKMVIAPLVFCTLVNGICGMEDAKEAGRLGVKALIYFEIATTLALAIGLVSVNFFEPGVGTNISLDSLNTDAIENYRDSAEKLSVVGYITHIVPNSMVSPFMKSDMIQVVFLSILFAFALRNSGETGVYINNSLKKFSTIFFSIVRIVVRYAPIAAFGAISFTVGKFGFSTLSNLGHLVLTFYITCIFFITIVLGGIAAYVKVNIFDLLRYLKQELLIVFSASSTEPALPLLIQKMKKLGCKESTVDLVVPTGYSFNLDGICIYMTFGAIFIAQSLNIDLTLYQQLTILAITLITSKGAAGVTGSGFIVLASTLSVFGTIPVEGMVIILGVDIFMSEARALTSFIGNAVATLFIAAWDNDLDYEVLRKEINAK